MTHLDGYDNYDPELLPPVVVRYLEQHSDPSERQAVSGLFSSDARVVDEGIEYSGSDAIRGWLGKTASEYTYTATPLGQHSPESDRWVVLVRLEGNFPGGVVDLRYQAAIRGELITGLVIAP